MLATLDPVTGSEQFDIVPAIGLLYPSMATEEEHRQICEFRIAHMMADACERGSKNLTLTVGSVARPN